MRISDWSSDVCSSDLTVRPSYHYQTCFNVFSSPDLVHWTKHSHALDVENVAWAAYAVWAPSAIEKDGKYYLFFGANDIQSDDQFADARFSTDRIPFVDSSERAREAADRIRAKGESVGIRPVVVSSCVDPELTNLISESGALVLDIFAPFIWPMERELRQQRKPSVGQAPGLVNCATYPAP